MNTKKFLLIAGSIILGFFIFTLLIPIYLDGVGVERAFNNSYGQYNNLFLENTHYDGINQKVVIKTHFDNIEVINQEELVEVSKKFMVEIQKYDIPKEMESIWIIFTNSQGYSIGSMRVDREQVKRAKWEEATDVQFKNAMNFK